MSTLRRGTIKSYNPGNHQADVQIAGSLGVWLEGIPVSSGIPAAEVDAGDECAVLFFTDDNPGDAVIIAVYPGAPAPGGGGGTRISDADADTYVDTEAAPDEDIVRVAVAGTQRLLVKNASIHLALDGDASLTGGLGIGPIAASTFAPSTTFLHAGDDGAGIGGKAGVIADLGGASSPGTGPTGVMGRAVARSSGQIPLGLDYLAGTNGVNCSVATCMRLQHIVIGSGVTLTSAVGFQFRSPSLVLGNVTGVTGILIDSIAAGSTRKAIVVGNITGGTTARLIELGSAPDFMVKGTGEYARAANQTAVWIAEGATPTVRQVRWKDGGSITAGDRVMVLV